MNISSTIGKNMNDIMWKYEVPPKMCRRTYIYQLITNFWWFFLHTSPCCCTIMYEINNIIAIIITYM